MLPQTLTEFAHAKINLALHVTGQRPDGYHLLDSLVVFAGIGDSLHVTPAETFSLVLEGPFGADLPAGEDNLVLRGARLAAGSKAAAIRLVKRLPPASGIGGGSADAAAAIRAMLRLRAAAGEAPVFTPEQGAQVVALGADVPVCLAAHPARMQGIGEALTWLPPLPELWVVLANPRVEVPTPNVFKALTQKENPPLPPIPAGWIDAAALANWLGQTRNDLQAPAMAAAPVIGDVLAALTALPGALFTRMSGSGATCFALFAKEDEAEAGADAVRREHPDWWVAHGLVYPGRADMQQVVPR